MVKPTIQQVQEYADSIGFDLNAEQFIAYYDTIGWVVGRGRNAKPVKSWKGCVRTWKIRAERQQAAAHKQVGERVKKFTFKPTVFVQCVKGPTTGRYMPIILRESYQRELPNERYIAAAEAMCAELNEPDGIEWIVRSDVDERTMMRERAAAAASLAKGRAEKKKPRGINKVVYEQIKEIKEKNARAKQLEDDLKF